MNSLNKFKKHCNVVDTPKLYYGKYAYRAEFNINGASLLSYLGSSNRYATFSKFNALVESRISNAKRLISESSGYYGSSNWSTMRHKATLLTDARLLYSIHEICQTLKGKIRLRTEHTTLSIFTDTEEQLLTILNGCRRVQSFLVEIQRPASLDVKARLEESVIFSKTLPKYKWKVQLRAKKYTISAREQIWNYLDNFPDAVILPKGVKGRLNPKNRQEWNQGNYYVNDESALLFLKMIAPDFVHKIFKLEQLPA